MKSSLKFSLAIISILFFTQLAKAQMHPGVGMSILTRDVNLGVSGKIFYDINESINTVGTATYYVGKGGHFGFDIDSYFTMFTIKDVSFNALLGYNIRKTTNYGTSMNLGLFCKFPTDIATVYFEPKVVIDNDSFIALSAGFIF